MKNTTLQILLLLSFFSPSAFGQEQKFPKAMNVIQGRVVEHRWEDNESHYYDWKGERVKDLTVAFDGMKTKYLFVDSTGKPINNELFDKASSFFKGLAVVQKPNDYNHEKPKQFAVFNEKGEFVFPYSTRYIENMGGGFVKLKFGDSLKIFDGQKREIASCLKCDFSLSATGRNIYQMPSPYSMEAPQLIRLYDLQGKLLIEKPGNRIGYVSNNVIYDNEPHSHEMPYHVIHLNPNDGLYSVVSDRGQLILDSVDNFVFNMGISCISQKGKKGFVVDSTFKTIIPPSFGYDRYWPLFKHPQEAFVAWRNDSVMVIDKKNHLLIKPIAATHIDYYDDQQYDIRDSRSGARWILTLDGDTVASPSRYFEYSEMRPVMTGALVRCQPGHLKGYISAKGETIIPCKYEQLFYAGSGHFIFFTEQEAGYLDLKGKTLLTVDSAISLSNFSNGLAIVGVKLNDFRYGAQRLIGADYAYSIVYKMIDSSGRVVSNRYYDEISKMHKGYCRVRLENDVYLVNPGFQKVLSKEGQQLISYFCNGLALAYDAKKDKVGLVNENLETVLPVMYDWIDTSDEENARYGYSISDRSEHGVYSNSGNICANVKDGKVRVRTSSGETTVEIKKNEK